jgi:excisionase family DNA binding protein
MVTDYTTPATPEAPALMPFREFMERSGLPRTTAYKLASENTLPVRVYRIGTKFYFVRAEVDAWLAGARQDSA